MSVDKTTSLDCWWLYLVECGDGSIYAGIASDVARRLREHRAGGARAARYLRGRGPLRLLIAQPVGSKGDALRAEYRLKRAKASQKRAFARKPQQLIEFISASCSSTPATGDGAGREQSA